MTSTALFTLASQASQEPQPELAQAGQSTHAPDLPALEEVQATLESLPQDTLMLGMAADGLPVLLNLYELAPSPILVVGDRGSGKTALLQLLARSVDLSPKAYSAVNASYEAQQDLRWLLLHGPDKRVWTVATLNTLRATRLRPWLGLFRTHIFGFIHQPALAQTLMRSTYSAGDPQADLASMLPGLEFSLKQETGWLRFWIPAMDMQGVPK